MTSKIPTYKKIRSRLKIWGLKGRSVIIIGIYIAVCVGVLSFDCTKLKFLLSLIGFSVVYLLLIEFDKLVISDFFDNDIPKSVNNKKNVRHK